MRRPFAVVPSLIALALTALTLPGAAAAEPLGVVVSVAPQKYLAERVGGERVRVTALVGEGQEPHGYDPTPRQMAGLAEARLYFALGTPFEEVWLPRMQVANPGMEVVATDAGIARRAEDHGHDHDHEPGQDAGQEDAHPALDPHVWLAPLLGRQIARNMRDALVETDPAGREAYEANFARLAAELEALDAELRGRLGRAPRRSFMVFHPAWGYFAEAYGLTQLAVEVEGKEPGPRGLETVIATAQAAGVRTVFVQPQFSPAAAETVARALGGRTVLIDPMAEDYLANLRRAGAAIAEALEAP